MPTKIDRGKYMASREWRLIRNEVIERAGDNCQRCHLATIDNVHHLTYERLGCELPNDLLGLCRECHEFISAERETDPAIERIQALLQEGQPCHFYNESPWDFGWLQVLASEGTRPSLMLQLGTKETLSLSLEAHDEVLVPLGDTGVLGLSLWL